MPRVMTDAYRHMTFVLPFTANKTECAYVRPLTDTEVGKIRLEATKEAGADEVLASRYFTRMFLEKSVTGWQGFYDAGGNELAFSREMLREICECDPEFASLLVLRIRNLARIGEAEERKNS